MHKTFSSIVHKLVCRVNAAVPQRCYVGAAAPDFLYVLLGGEKRGSSSRLGTNISGFPRLRTMIYYGNVHLVTYTVHEFVES